MRAQVMNSIVRLLEMIFSFRNDGICMIWRIDYIWCDEWRILFIVLCFDVAMLLTNIP
ncbi:hypothetical protein DICVIV_01991 [Dictyocaulus viviparus]|uniref:Uncharacterized protein n=1 Tax=Dictyocaulus viviparus TaxID=29172 RepID=A0A0D8Y511_DICVI|nr:hypothetical protein DICVIV_01991 [Dictyocaulus viviparus]